MKTSYAKRNIHGILLLDKRLGVSSNRALQEVKRLFNANKAGHTGSLDPLATGLLPICFGEATKVSGMMLDDDKRYQVTVLLGIKTDTGDLEGNIVETHAIPEFSVETIRAILAKFTGEIDQIPPMYSALKQNGKKLYELARDGITVERKARHITIFELTLLAFQKDSLALEVHCSKGTYIRSLAEDIGQELGCGATVQALRRTQAGRFHIGQTNTLEQLQALDDEQLLATLINVDAPLQTMPAVYLNDQQATAIKYGQLLDLNESLLGSVRMYATTEFLGLGEMRLDGKLAPKKLFNLNI
ncbi:tRNA pseudouridine synthase B [Methyloglobulus morosus KoM1]|uniref:tRNA pseudouridine synthase B n=1 Tax=Methyloglobulus morosus KoM1 TaxID=1116472 RepID=V5BHL9_9GAMM|nr:tRNA pseudouridine(55) synthase TruB [Methyloglobulus morosus]ESS72805.1 tRNA pseudouridine synthase B [Methyloglobulus morosus KoM1]